MSPPNEVAKILQLYDCLYTAIETKTGPDQPLLLAHYTSVQVIEQILRNDEIWFGNPLYMNDLEELRLGLLIGSQIFPEFAEKAADSADKAASLTAAYNHYLAHLASEAVLDTYVFCLSEHPAGNTDGRLSMWREYGSKGNGAALVVNTQKLHYLQHNPIIIAKVAYNDNQGRECAIRAGLENWANITRSASIADGHLHLAAYAAFGFVKSLALATKHTGFNEEMEWRAVYVPERDPFRYLTKCLDYFVGPRGIEPKLKYKFGVSYQPNSPSADVHLASGELADIIEFVLLGPSVSSPLAKASFVRMLERIGKSAFRDRVFSSTIPLRPSL